MKRPRPWLLFFACLTFACGSRPTTPFDAGTLWPEGAQSVVATSEGGYWLVPCPLPDGGTLRSSTWRLALTTGTLEYSVCAVSSNPRSVMGTRTLNEAELRAILSSLQGITPSSATSCGADAPTNRLVVTTASGTVRFKDSFYACQPEAQTQLVDNLDPVFALLAQLAE